ncbi:MAG UNVERIFIED_CONTAM: hypothetical protein LVT10_17760 [Anaerolineae bacterium]
MDAYQSARPNAGGVFPAPRHWGAIFRRERLSTPDGDFIDLDYVDFPFATWRQLGEDAPIVLHIHGLGGNARSNLAQQVYYTLSQRGASCRA